MVGGTVFQLSLKARLAHPDDPLVRSTADVKGKQCRHTPGIAWVLGEPWQHNPHPPEIWVTGAVADARSCRIARVASVHLYPQASMIIRCWRFRREHPAKRLSHLGGGLPNGRGE